MQRKKQAIDYALSLIDCLQNDIQVLWQLVEEICDAEQGDLNELVAQLDAQKKQQERQEKRRLRDKARSRARKWAEQTFKNKNNG
jgi:hypothetical protein